MTKTAWRLAPLVMVAYSSLVFSQTYEVRVFEKGTGRSLRRAEVAIGEQRWFVNDQGIIPVDCPAGSKAVVSHSGYEAAEVEFAEDASPRLYLVPQRISDENVVIVRGKRSNQVSQVKITGNEAKEIAPRGDPVQVTKLLPGVQASPFQPLLVVRGSEPDDSTYYIDSIAVPFVYHSIGGISILPDKVISDVEFAAGGFSPRYGETTGGIVGIVTSNEIPQQATTEFTLNIPAYSGLFHEQPLGEHDVVSASYRKSYLDAAIKNFVTDDQVVVPGFQDAHLRWVHKREGGYTKVLSVSSQDTLKLLIPVGGDENGNLNFTIDQYYGVLGVEQFGTINNNWTYTASPNTAYSKFNTDVLDNFVYIRGWSYRLPVVLSRRLGGAAKFHLGSEVQYDDFAIDILAPDVNPDDPFEDFEDAPQIKTKRNFRHGIYSAWTSYDIALGPWMLTPGVRSSYNGSIQKTTTDPRLQVSFQASPATLLKAAAGRYAKAPQPQESDGGFGNPNLGFEVSQHYILGAEHTLNERWFTDTQVYYKTNAEMVRSHPETRYANTGERRSYGLELFVRRQQTGRAFGWLSYTLSKTEERANNDEAWGPTKVDQTHVVNLVTFYRLSNRWSLGNKVNYHSGDRYTPVNSAVYNASLAKYQPRYKEEERYRERLPAYHQIDVYSAYDFLWDTWKLKLRTGVEYFSLSKKVFGVTYNYDFSKEEYFSGIPVIPYIELSGVF
jgi:hypothetical protein